MDTVETAIRGATELISQSQHFRRIGPLWKLITQIESPTLLQLTLSGTVAL